jgi:hypothetical protein
VPALAARAVLEIEDVAAGLALEQLHGCSVLGRWSRDRAHRPSRASANADRSGKFRRRADACRNLAATHLA